MHRLAGLRATRTLRSGSGTQGASLVALVVVLNRTVRVYLGIVASYSKDIAESAKLEQGRIQLRVSFFDPEVELMALRGEPLCVNKSTFAVLVDNGVMYESMRPFCTRSRRRNPRRSPSHGI